MTSDKRVTLHPLQSFLVAFDYLVGIKKHEEAAKKHFKKEQKERKKVEKYLRKEEEQMRKAEKHRVKLRKQRQKAQVHLAKVGKHFDGPEELGTLRKFTCALWSFAHDTDRYL